MKKITLGAEAIRGEVQKRLLIKPYVSGDWSALSIPLPQKHAPDAQSRNWDMKEVQATGDIRAIVEEARREFFFSDDADHDQEIGEAFTRI